MTIEVVYIDRNLRIGRVGSLMTVALAGEIPLAAFEVLDDMYGQAVKEHSKISLLSVIGELADSPLRRQAKMAAQRLVEKYQHHLRASVTVITMKGVGGALLRTLAAGFNLMHSTEYPSRVFATVEEGLRWLETVPGHEMQLSTEQMSQFALPLTRPSPASRSDHKRRHDLRA